MQDFSSINFGARTRGVLRGVLDRRRNGKEALFKSKVSGGYSGPRILAEGDSWFEYPFSEDLLVPLGAKHAVLSLAKAGDSFADVSGQNDELFKTLANPPGGKDFHIVMLSLGGNEVMGQIEEFVDHHNRSKQPVDHIRPAFDDMLKDVEKKYHAILTHIVGNGTQHVILHGYDYPDPRFSPEPGESANGSQWLGPQFKSKRGFETLPSYREIVNEMLDRFNAKLAALPARPEYDKRVHYVRLLGTIGPGNWSAGNPLTNWFDEIHPTDTGFQTLAKRFEPAINTAWSKLQAS